MKTKLSLFLLLFPGTFFAQQPTPTDTLLVGELQEIVVAADYLAEPLSPVSYQDLTVGAISGKNTGQEPSFILSETPAMTVYSDAGSYQGYSYFRLRGIDQTRLNMTLDGVPLNEPEDQGVYFSNYPDFFNSLDRVQIQRGVGTSKNGSASYGGSLQFSSPNLFDDRRLELGAGYGSYHTYRMYGEYNSGVKKNKGLYLRGSHLHSDGYKEHSANTSSSVFYSGGLYFDKSSLKLTGFSGRQKNELAWLGVPLEKIDRNPRTNGNNEREDDQFTQSLTQLQHSWYPGKHATLRSSIFYNHLRGNYDFDLNNFLGIPPTEELFNYAFRSHFGGFFSTYTYELPALKWTTGVNLNRYGRQHTGSISTAGEIYRNTGFKDEIAVFSKAGWQVDHLLFYIDLQYRSVDFSYDGSVDLADRSWQFFNPKLGLTYTFSNQLSAYYSIGRTGREPTRNDMFGGSDDLPTDSMGNPILFIVDPEYVTDQELGLRFKNEKWEAGLNFYYMNFRNEIVLNGQFGPNGLLLNENVERSYRSGLELQFTYRPCTWLTLINASAFNHSRIEEQGADFQPILTPRLIINQEFIVQKLTFETALTARYQSSSYIDFANEQTIDGYLLLNWRGTYRLDKWQFSLLINNLTNTRYFNHAYVDFDGINKYFIQAPINFYTMVSVTF
ncbi:MAG: TonB-dependent receptor [Saprospiraceae bacterium]|nr:TonB-dependent receptor [Lewinella sp.]